MYARSNNEFICFRGLVIYMNVIYRDKGNPVTVRLVISVRERVGSLVLSLTVVNPGETIRSNEAERVLALRRSIVTLFLRRVRCRIRTAVP